MTAVTSEESALRRVAIREFAAWVVGAILGAYAGLRFGFSAWRVPGALIGGWIGWGLGGYGFFRAIKALGRSAPRHTISRRAARDACFAMMLGLFAGSYLADRFNADRVAGILAGMIVGLIIGAVIGETSAQASQRKNALSRPPERRDEQECLKS